MKEAVLKEFFMGRASATELADDLEGSKKRTGQDVFSISVEDIKEEFHIEPPHLISVCDAFLKEKINEENIEVIGFALMASDTFTWDNKTEEGNRIEETANCWASPRINYTINKTTMKKFALLLKTGEDLFEREDLNS